MYRPAINDFGQDVLEFCRRHRVVILLFLSAMLCDAFSTAHVMLRAGTANEIHPLVRAVSASIGPVIGPFIGAAFKIAGGLIICAYVRRYAAAILILASASALIGLFYNLYAQQLYLHGTIPFLPI
jgi:hypothetical protein